MGFRTNGDFEIRVTEGSEMWVLLCRGMWRIEING